MLKANNPAWLNLFADIQRVVSERYVEDLEVMSGIYKKVGPGEDGEEFGANC